MKRLIILIIPLFLVGCETLKSLHPPHREGCSTYECDCIKNEGDAMLQKEREMATIFKQRRYEIEQAHSQNKITEAEYLNLKTNLENEINNYFANEEISSQLMLQNCHNNCR